jgi:hypothetical protein
MRQLIYTITFTLHVLLASAQVPGPDKAYQDALITSAGSPYLMSDGRLLFITEGNLSITGGGRSTGTFLKCLQGNQEVWQYKIAEGTILESDIVVHPDGTIYVGLIDLSPCNGFVETIHVWIQLTSDGQLIKKQTLNLSEILALEQSFTLLMKLSPTQAKAYVLVFNDTATEIRSIDLDNNLTIAKVVTLPIDRQLDFPLSITLDSFGLNTVWVASANNIFKIQGDSVQAIIPGGVFSNTELVTFAPDGSTVTFATRQLISTYAITPEGIGPLLAQTTINSSSIVQLATLTNGELCAIGITGGNTECLRWPSSSALASSSPTITKITSATVSYEVIPTIEYILSVHTGQYFPFSIDGNTRRTTAEVRRHAWSTGAPYVTYPDLVLESVNLDPDTWGYTYGGIDNPQTYINCTEGGIVTVLNQSNTTINSLVLTAFYEKLDFIGCGEDRYMRRRFDNLNLTFGQRIELPLDPFINQNTPGLFGPSPNNKPFIFVWVAAPNDLPDYSPYNNGRVVTDFFNERTPPGIFNVFPNPVTGDILTITIVPQDLDQARFRIYNMLGQLALERKVSNSEEYYYLPIHDLPKGMYCLRVGEESKIFMRN